MPLISTVTGSFTAGRRANAFGSTPWSPADITTAFWIDASDTCKLYIEWINVTAVQTRQETPLSRWWHNQYKHPLNGKNTHFQHKITTRI